MVLVNIFVFFFLFLVLEFTFRVYKDGPKRALMAFLPFENRVPYSNLGTGKWVISDDELGYRLNPAVFKNSLSIRGPEVKIPKPQNVRRILFLGDSITWARPGFVDQIGTSFPAPQRVEVINAGVPGYGTHQESIFLKRFLLKTEPDLIVLVYCLNDNHPNLHRFNERAEMLWTKEAQDELRIRTTWDWIVSESYVLTTIKVGLLSYRPDKRHSEYEWEQRVDFHIAWEEESYKASEQEFIQMKTALAKIGSQIVCVIVPFEPQLKAEYLKRNRDYVLFPQQKMAGICRRNGIQYLDLFPVFLKESSKSESLFLDGIHLNEKGHRIAANAIYQFLAGVD